MKSLISRSQTLQTAFVAELAQVTTQDQLESVRLTYLSRKGALAELMTLLKELSPEDKREAGPLLNTLKTALESSFNAKQRELTEQAFSTQDEQHKHFDVTAYRPGAPRGSLHPYTLITREIEDIFMSMGYEIVDGPEVEMDYYNFGALNIPENHPARDVFDTFWLDVPGMLLRTHTSPVQVRVMEHHTLPLAVAAPGRVYRHEATDASHDVMFLQAEGLFIDRNVSMANLIATVKTFLQKLFGKKDLKIRLRPGYFPFVEPGVEIDLSCPFCSGGCSTCKRSGWIEMMGAGLVHPNVLRASQIDPAQWGGFAFGFGLTRLAMLKYGINDIRLFMSNSVRFLSQF